MQPHQSSNKTDQQMPNPINPTQSDLISLRNQRKMKLLSPRAPPKHKPQSLGETSRCEPNNQVHHTPVRPIIPMYWRAATSSQIWPTENVVCFQSGPIGVSPRFARVERQHWTRTIRDWGPDSCPPEQALGSARARDASLGPRHVGGGMWWSPPASWRRVTS